MNVARLLERAALYHGDRVALVVGERRWTYKVPETVEFLTVLPKNPTGKILKKGAAPARVECR